MRKTSSQSVSGAFTGLESTQGCGLEPERVTELERAGNSNAMSHDQLRALMEHAEEAGCVNLSAFSQTVTELELDDEEVCGALRAARGARDRAHRRLQPAGRQRDALLERDGRRDDDRLAPAVPQRGRALPAADRRGGGRARQADRARRPAGEGQDDQLEPPPRRLDREEVPGPRALAARPDPGGDHRADPRRREVRLAPRLQVLDLCDLVDPPGGAARRREQVAHDPDPRPHRRARAEDRARRARADAEARTAADGRGGREEGEAVPQARPRDAGGGARGRESRQAARRRGRHRLRGHRRHRQEPTSRRRSSSASARTCFAPRCRSFRTASSR